MAINMRKVHKDTSNIEELLQHRILLEKTCAEISSLFLDDSDFDHKMHLALELIGRVQNVDRSYLCRYDLQGNSMTCTHEWHSSDTDSLMPAFQKISLKFFYWLLQELALYKHVCIPDVSKMPAAASREQKICTKYGMKACLFFVLIVDHEVIGFIGFDDVRGIREWNQEDILVLRTVSEIISRALKRQKDEHALKESEMKYRELFENANDIIYTHDFDGNFTSANRAAERIYGYTQSEIFKLTIRDIIDPEYFPLALENMKKKLHHVEMTDPYELLTYAKNGSPVWVEVNSRIQHVHGIPVGVQGIARDITERKLAEQKLVDSYRYLGILNRKIAILLQFGKKQRFHRNLRGESKVYDFILESAMDLSHAKIGALFLYDSQKEVFRLSSFQGLLPKDRNLIQRVFVRDVPWLKSFVKKRVRIQMNISDFSLRDLPLTKKYQLKYFIAVPFHNRQKLLGALVLAFSHNEPLTTQELDFYEVFALQTTSYLGSLEAQNTF